MLNATKRNIKKYGKDACIKAVELANKGYGASSIADELVRKHNANIGDALVNAGLDILK